MKMKELIPPEVIDETVSNRLLQLIEDGDATVILSSEYSESLNELIKFEFVAIENEKLLLTGKGQQAKLLGIAAMIDKDVNLSTEINLSDFPQQDISRGISNQSFLIVLLFFLVSLLATITLIYS